MTDSIRRAALDLPPDEFRRLGHEIIELVARHIETLPDRPITTGDAPSRIRELLGQDALADAGADPGPVLEKVCVAALRPLAVQRPPEVLGLHHGIAGAVRHAGRPAGVGH